MKFVDNLFIQYLTPFALGFLVLFTLYRFIPEMKVHTRAAIVAAAVGSLLWEVFKRIFVIYVAKFSAVGVVLSKLVQGTLTSIIFFLLWITFSLAIVLWGAELAVRAERAPGAEGEGQAHRVGSERMEGITPHPGRARMQ